MSFPKKVRKFRTENRKSFPKSSTAINDSINYDVATVLSESLRESFGDSRAVAKSLMRITGAGERTVKNWLEGKNLPCAENLINLASHSDEILYAFLFLADREHIAVNIELEAVRTKMIDLVEHIDVMIGKSESKN
jgi:hypothetical protein